MKKIALILFALFAFSAHAQLTNLGKITLNTSLVWDKNSELDIAGYFVYAYPGTNAAAVYRVPTITNGIPAASLIGTNANGLYSVYVTAINTAGLESSPSALINLTFSKTNLIAPQNLQVFVYTIATNLIPLQQIK
jgi:hypothetical protein